jgi:hypothetical protein
MKRNVKKERYSFSTRRGLFLSLSIGAFMALIILLVFYSYILPMLKSFE